MIWRPPRSTRPDPHLPYTTRVRAGLIEQVRERYDLVILDTPPVLPVDEARVIASMADGVVFLVRWRKTPSKAASVALRRLYDVHAEMLGAVLTLVDVGEQEDRKSTRLNSSH